MGKEKILFVDDEKSMVNTIQPMIEHLGYNPILSVRANYTFIQEDYCLMSAINLLEVLMASFIFWIKPSISPFSVENSSRKELKWYSKSGHSEKHVIRTNFKEVSNDPKTKTIFKAVQD